MRMRVSLCMIARNEASTLPRCLASVADLVDEIIVVDTGSNDNTGEVARQLGASVHEFTWVDDFAAARNESLRHATGEWIFWLDGDEYLDADNRAGLRGLLNGLDDENSAYLMRQRSRTRAPDGDAVFFQCRLFRNLPAIRWRYRVHEQIQPAVEKAGGIVRATAICIDHSGYDDEAVYRRKLERNIKLLLLEDRERPNDPFTLMNLGWAYKDMGQVAAALAYYRRGLVRCPQESSIASKLHALVVRGHLSLGQRQDALAECRTARVRFPDDVELSFLEAVLLSELGDLPGAEALFFAPARKPADGSARLRRQPRHARSHGAAQLADLHRAEGRVAEAETQWRTALSQRPDSVRSLFELGQLYLEQDRRVEAQSLIRQLEGLGALGGLAATLLQAEGLSHWRIRRGPASFGNGRRDLAEGARAAGLAQPAPGKIWR